MRYTVREFSMTKVGIWDKNLNDFVKNPSGRRALFFKEASAKKLAEKLNAAEQQSKEERNG